MKRIALIIPTLKGGGAERVASVLSNGLALNGHEVYVIVYEDHEHDYSYSGKLLSLNVPHKKTIVGKCFCFVKRIIKLRTIKNQYSIDTAISFLDSANILNILTKGKSTTIVSVRNYISLSNKGIYGKIGNLAIEYIYKHADVIVCVSNLIRSTLAANFGLDDAQKNIAIYNPYDLNDIDRLKKDELTKDELTIFSHPTVIAVGSLTDQKGHWHLLRSFSEVKKNIPDAKLVILGKGDLFKYLKQLSVDLKLEDDIFFLGFKRNPYQYLNKATVFVLPSLFEGFPNALCEAMACGLPIISADCKSGPREILAPNTPLDTDIAIVDFSEYGILIPVCDGKKYDAKEPLKEAELLLAKAITRLLGNKDLMKLYSEQSKERVKAFGVDSIVKEWEKII